MVWWIVAAVVVLSLIVLAVAIVPLLGRLSGLNRAMARLQGRQREAEVLQRGAAVLEQNLTAVQQRADVLQLGIENIKGGRPSAAPRP
jgi:hypothetical protein